VDPVKLLQKHKWLLIGSAVVGSVIGFAAHIVWMRTAPVWRPTMLFQCNAPINNAAQSPELGMSSDEMNRTMSTQVRLMTGERVLSRVVQDPNFFKLGKTWTSRFIPIELLKQYEASPDLATFGRIQTEIQNNPKLKQQLAKDVSARVLTSTNLIELSFSFKDKLEATEILKLVGQKYADVNREQRDRDRRDQTANLEDGIKKIDGQLAEVKRKRENLVNLNKLESVRSAVESAQSELRGVTEELQRVSLTKEGLLSRKLQMEAEYNKPGGINYSNELRGEVDQDPLVLDIKSRISSIETAQKAMLIENISPEHRSFQRLVSQLQAQKDSLDVTQNQLLKERFDSQLDAIRNQIDQLNAQETKLLKTKEELTQKSTSLANIDAQLADLENENRSLQDTRAQTSQQLMELQMISNLATANRISIVTEATMPNDVSFPKLAFMLPLGILLTSGLVSGAVLVRELMDQRVKGPSDISIMPRTKLLGWIPDAAEDPAGQGTVETAFRDRSRGVVAESYRQIRASLAKRLDAAGHRSLLILAGMPGSGGTTTVTNLALAFAAAEKRVLIIDANFRRPAMNRIFGVQEGPGLGDVLAKVVDLKAAVQPTSTPGVEVLTAGTKEQRVLERLGTDSMNGLLAAAGAMYDLILIDTAPALVAGDGLALAQRCDATALVVRAFGEKRGLVARIRNELSDARSEFMGVLVNSVRASAGGYLRGNFRATQEYHLP
jgi:capsular exopolysaccharide synthesis family protein